MEEKRIIDYRLKSSIIVWFDFLLIAGSYEVSESVTSLVPRHLLTPVRYMRTHGGKPF